ncbi:multiprotein-bridging factor 1, partial [Quaeritorhiza haematococci]
MTEEWDQVTVIRKRSQPSAVLKTNSAVNAARRSGASVQTEKKVVHTNVKGSLDPSKAAKIDRETEDFHIERVNLSVAKAIQKGRQEKGLTQKELATKINEKQTVVNEYEAGKGIPNQQILGKMERVLGIKLRGKNVGEKIEPR